ncbi:unnamed protein product, partial [marine sediment metagenome]
MELLGGIYSRRSVRQYKNQRIEREQLLEIIKAGTWAPSGLNNQPWRFVIIQEQSLRHQLAALTKFGRIIEGAPVAIAVFLDKKSVYHDVKDYQAMGACLQNMLLAAHAMGLGAVWLGEILKNSDLVRALLELPDDLEFMAVIAIGHPVSPNQT